MVINYNDDHRSEKVSCHRLLDDVDLSAWGEKKVIKSSVAIAIYEQRTLLIFL